MRADILEEWIMKVRQVLKPICFVCNYQKAYFSLPKGRLQLLLI